MRRFRSFLGLFLAFVTLLGLCAVPASADEQLLVPYTDVGDITYREGVEVLSAIGVMNGRTNGAFEPKGTLVRRDAAVLITRLLGMGDVRGESLFTDIDDPFYQPFIAYVHGIGIVDGYGDGRFGPNDPLTGYAFAKMLLGALGYDAVTEGLTGPGWEAGVAKLARATQLTEDMPEFQLKNQISREQAAQMAFNALQTTMVFYEETDSLITVTDLNADPDTDIARGVFAFAYSYTTSKEERYKEIRDRTADGHPDRQLVELGERYWPTLRRESVFDPFHRPTTYWRYQQQDVGKYVDTPTLTYTDAVALADIYAALELPEPTVAEVYVDGLRRGDLTLTLEKDSRLQTPWGLGTAVEVYYDAREAEVSVVAVHTYPGKMQKLKSADKTQERFYILTLDTEQVVSTDFMTFATGSGYKDGDVVTYTYSRDTKEVVNLAVAKAVSGKAVSLNLDGENRVRSVTLGSDELRRAAETYVQEENIVPVMRGLYNGYLDTYGNLIYLKEQDSLRRQYALVLDLRDNTSAFDKRTARLICADGKERFVTLNDSYPIDEYKDRIVLYDVKDDLYALSLAGESGGVSVEDLSSKFVMRNKDEFVTLAENTVVRADARTVVVVFRNNSWRSYTGYKSMPSIKAKSGINMESWYYKPEGSDTAAVIFINAQGATVDENTDQPIFLAANSRKNGDDSYYTYNAVEKNQIVKLNVSKNVNLPRDWGTGTGVGIMEDGKMHQDHNAAFSEVSKNGGTITRFTAFSSDIYKENLLGIEREGVNRLKIGGSSGDEYTLSRDPNIFFVDKDGHIGRISSDYIQNDEDDHIVFTTKNDAINNLYIQEVNSNAHTVTLQVNSNSVASNFNRVKVKDEGKGLELTDGTNTATFVTFTVENGKNLYFSFDVLSGYEISVDSVWIGGTGTVVTPDDGIYRVENVQSDLTINVSFKSGAQRKIIIDGPQDTFTASVNNNPYNANSTYPDGTSATVKLEPHTGYRLKTVTVDSNAIAVDTLPVEIPLSFSGSDHRIEVTTEAVLTFEFGQAAKVTVGEQSYECTTKGERGELKVNSTGNVTLSVNWDSSTHENFKHISCDGTAMENLTFDVKDYAGKTITIGTPTVTLTKDTGSADFTLVWTHSGWTGNQTVTFDSSTVSAEIPKGASVRIQGVTDKYIRLVEGTNESFSEEKGNGIPFTLPADNATIAVYTYSSKLTVTKPDSTVILTAVTLPADAVENSGVYYLPGIVTQLTLTVAAGSNTKVSTLTLTPDVTISVDSGNATYDNTGKKLTSSSDSAGTITLNVSDIPAEASITLTDFT